MPSEGSLSSIQGRIAIHQLTRTIILRMCLMSACEDQGFGDCSKWDETHRCPASMPSRLLLQLPPSIRSKPIMTKGK